jgi:phosphohistidine swiveling domain-containing protein
MGVLVQVMVDAEAAGVAFTADPVTGARETTVVEAVAGLGEPLVAGLTGAQEWTADAFGVALTGGSRDGDAGAGAGDGGVLTARAAEQVVVLARRVEAVMGGPQDVEWALDGQGLLYLLQARPMTALPIPVTWTPPQPGHWMRTFRLGEWLPDPMTPLFADWLLPLLEDGYLAWMRQAAGVGVPFRYAAINGWYYTAPPALTPVMLARTLAGGRRRLVRLLFNALFRVGRNPAAADRAVLGHLAAYWDAELLPTYRDAVRQAETTARDAGPGQLIEVVDRLGDLAGRYLWSLAIVGGSAWKMEAALARSTYDHLADVLAGAHPLVPEGGSAQHLLSGLPGIDTDTPGHAVQSVDWYHPTAGELGWATPTTREDEQRVAHLTARRQHLETACRTALASTPRRARQWDALLAVAQRYTVLRERQAHDFTLAWPALRRAALRLGQLLHERDRLLAPHDVFFLTRNELDDLLAPGAHPAGDQVESVGDRVEDRRRAWQRQRRLVAPLTTGTGQRAAERAIAAAVAAARAQHNGGAIPGGVLVGHPASPGRATGPVRLITDAEDFATLQSGDVLLARTTAPAWTPLFSRACAVVTDAGTLAAHASLIAREYGIPAVVGTGDATRRLRRGQLVTVDGSTGLVHLQPQAQARSTVAGDGCP